MCHVNSPGESCAARKKARRPSGRTAHQIRSCYQSDHRHPAAGRSGDRMKLGQTRAHGLLGYQRQLFWLAQCRSVDVSSENRDKDRNNEMAHNSSPGNRDRCGNCRRAAERISLARVPSWRPPFEIEPPRASQQRGLSMIIGMSVGAFTLLHVIISLVAIGSGLIVVGGMYASNSLPVTTALFL